MRALVASDFLGLADHLEEREIALIWHERHYGNPLHSRRTVNFNLIVPNPRASVHEVP